MAAADLHQLFANNSSPLAKASRVTFFEGLAALDAVLVLHVSCHQLQSIQLCSSRAFVLNFAAPALIAWYVDRLSAYPVTVLVRLFKGQWD